MASRLADSISPYLRAHAGNPVAWFPWGSEAFEVARQRGVPVMVSIGYSTCHWCHVMARESFSDPQTAADLNAGFVSIKVDREEHPEVDAAYLAAAGAFTQSLGWPLTVFTTPDGEPFFAGTYWPPRPQPPMASFRQVLGAVRDAWTQRREAVTQTGRALAEALAEASAASAPADLPTKAQLIAAAERLAAREDPVHGGFGATGPKFPAVPALRFLQSMRDDAPDAAAVASRAFAAMVGGELRDTVEGGFFRYATRPDWTGPHYERMLTDNAGLLEVALDEGSADVAEGIVSFLVNVLQRPPGGFGAAQDSESMIAGERSEGGYYARDAAARAELDAPAVDGKVVTGWNGMAIGALARSARLSRGALDAARLAADAVLESNVAPDGRLVRASLDEIPSRAPATLEDYALLAEGLLVLATATGEVVYALTARDLVDRALAGDIEPDPTLAAHGLHAPASRDDGTLPSGPSAFAAACVTLWRLGAGDRYREAAVARVRAASTRALAEPLGFGALLRTAHELITPVHQLVVVTDDPDAPLVTAAICTPGPDIIAIVSAPQATAFAEAGFALFDGKVMQDGLPTAYDCRDFACRLPVTDPAVL
ncbi:MAG: thioredoxin domain-containing protein [Microbacterium sp.]|uniref:thioredoxin domain-containing protein n=1 Tax=Microbacterium sp. TaxID=51671 RepID=UPI003A8717D4